MRLRLALLLLAVSSACSSGSSGTGGGAGGGTAGGSGGAGGGAGASFTLVDLDDAGTGLTYLAMASDPVAQRVGVAYFVDVGRADGGMTDNFEVRYVEWKAGVATAPQRLREVQRTVGISVAFQQGGEPAVSYLGGGSDNSIFWFQSDAVVNYRSGGATWTEQTALVRSSDLVCPGNPPTEIGFLVGLWPSLVFDGATAILAYRDAHNGSFKMQDWGPSAVKVSTGGPTAWTTTCAALGNDTAGYGGRIALILANGQPAMTWDAIPEGADTQGHTVYFQKRTGATTWAAPVNVLNIVNTQSGASLAWDATEGYGIAVLEHSDDTLQYTKSADGVSWSTAANVYGSGQGGWYPSLAIDPILHQPAIAFYICGAGTGPCQVSKDELRVSQYTGAEWREISVDKEGAFLPKLGFFSNGKRFIVYLVPGTGKLRLALEN